MTWSLEFIPDAQKDLNGLDNSQRMQMVRAIEKVRQNPLPDYEGGYGKPLGNKRNINLSGCLKIKLKSSGLRAVYRLIRTESTMQMIVIGLRHDEEVYQVAKKRLQKMP